MLRGIITKVVGDPNEREIRKLQPIVDAINALEPEMEQRAEVEFRSLTGQFRSQITAGTSLDDILVEAYAVVREVAKRTVDMRPFDVQLIGGIVLHQGKVAEMRTGEGKTLVATMPVYLNALQGRGVHLVTVNDYLARRDSLWMGPVYHTLGLSVGLLQSGADQPAYLLDPTYQRDPYPGLRPVPRREAYAADVVYGTNNEFGFDYLRDNLALSLERRVQRPLYFAIVDEVDNIFIDEARTPLIISGPSDESVDDYGRFAAIARQLEPEIHFELDEKERTVFLTDEGLAVVEQETGVENIYDEANYRYVHYMQQALKAHVLFQEGRDYIRQRKQIILIDQHTGRLMPSRRLSEGLHQAIEAKEGVPIRPRDVTSATVTIQNYFRMYEKLAGMSGTAVTESEEFFKIYELDVVAIPTHKPVIRQDHPDVVYRSEEAKLRAVAREILDCHARGQPVLVGTTSVEMSERLSRRLSGERLQMACLAPRIAFALQDTDLERDDRARLRETLDTNLETANSAAWNRLLRALGLDHNALSSDSLAWISEYLQLPEGSTSHRTLEHALREGIPHEILNAKEHTREAAIIARAGQPGSVTIATNMAGRGVDIKLGGDLSDDVIHSAHQVLRARGLNPFAATGAQMDSAVAEVAPQYSRRRDQVVAAGGLHVLGTERHEARRIDNQLRGRSGRQGEPGSSRFYLSLEDDLMRRFGRREMLSRLMEQIGDDFPIEHGLVSRTIERAQTSVEGHNFDIRKHLLEYDDVLNRQRETIYGERLRILQSDDLRPEVDRMLERQVDEYLERFGSAPDQRRLLFASLDDIVQLTLVAPTAPYQGPVAFVHLTAFPPLTVSFIADRLTGQSEGDIQRSLQEASLQAAGDYGQQILENVAESARVTLDKYDERLQRYRDYLDERIEDFAQMLEERGQPFDPRRLGQYLERTFPLKVTVPRGSEAMSLDDLREHWLAQIEVEFHRQTIAGLLDRIRVRLPEDMSLERFRPAIIPGDKVEGELRRVLDVAARQAGDEQAQRRLSQIAVAQAPDPDRLAQIITAVKESSLADYSRLDRLVGHVAGVRLDNLLAGYQEAAGEQQASVRRDLDRLRDSIMEGKRGGRTDVLELLRQLNSLVFVDIADAESLLSLAVAHEYDKWAQRQVAELRGAVKQNQLTGNTWVAIVEHLLAAHYVQRQTYDRGHRRRASWLPRIPLAYLAEALPGDAELDYLRPAILNSLRGAAAQRERSWGAQAFEQWRQLTLDDLDETSYDSLLRHLGEQQLADWQELAVDELPPHVYGVLRFAAAMRGLEGRRISDLPHSEALVAHLTEQWELDAFDRPIGSLSGRLRELIERQLRTTGRLDDQAAIQKLADQPIRDWDQATRREVAVLLGKRAIDADKHRAVGELSDRISVTVQAHLQRQQYFVDEAAVQRFLVHQRLGDLQESTAQAALLRLARSRLERLSRRKILNLDVKTRQVALDTLQQLGLFTDQTRRDQLLGSAVLIDSLGPEILAGFRVYLARQQTLAPQTATAGEVTVSRLSLGDLGSDVSASVTQALRAGEALIDRQRRADVRSLRLGDLDPGLARAVQDDLRSELLAELDSKTMEDLRPEMRKQVHEELSQRDYFVDAEKASWYERRTLAQLPSELMHGLEAHLGRIRLSAIAATPFRELPAETREMLEASFDREGVLTERAQRLRLTQTGKLGDLLQSDQELVARQLGRQWLVDIRDRRPPNLPDPDRLAVWSYLRGEGYFTDEFKEELFAYQQLGEFDTSMQEAVRTALIARLEASLETQPIGELPADLQDLIDAQLQAAGFFIDEDRSRQIRETPMHLLPPDLGLAVDDALGRHLLGQLALRPIADWPPEQQSALWQYLDQTGYFLDVEKRNQVMDRRLADLSSEHYDAIAVRLAEQIGGEIADQPVSELDPETRQGLREALVILGHFDSSEEQSRVLSQSLGDLRREDLDALAPRLGQSELDALAQKRLGELDGDLQQAILSHLQARDWFLDRERLDAILRQRPAELDPDLRQALVSSMRSQQSEYYRTRRLGQMDRGLELKVRHFLQQQGLGAEESEMRPFRSLSLRELEPELSRELLRLLGSQVVTDWESVPFQEMDESKRELLSAYLGRQLMGRIEQRVLLYTISRLWVSYLTDIEDLRRGVGLEAYGQRDPLVEYKRQAFELFEKLGDDIRRTVVRSLFRQQPEALVTP